MLPGVYAGSDARLGSNWRLLRICHLRRSRARAELLLDPLHRVPRVRIAVLGVQLPHQVVRELRDLSCDAFEFVRMP